MVDGHRCKNCGSLSQDPLWCQVCGADLQAQRPAADWLEVGDSLSLTLSSPPDEYPEIEAQAPDDTLPPPGLRTVPAPVERAPTDQLAPVIERSAAPSALRSPSLSRTIELTQSDEHRVAIAASDVTLTIRELVSRAAHKRVWLADGDDGRVYRVEEREGAASEAVPQEIAGLAALLDLPLGATTRSGRFVKVYFHRDGQLMHERLAARSEPMTPAEIVEWMRPITRAVETIHNAGFICLRVCPYTVKYRPDGRVFLHGVEVLYAVGAPFSRLPAIAGYTAPEVYEASVDSVITPTSDIYSLAMIVYFLIARADPPSSTMTRHLPAVLPRDIAPDFPIGFAPALNVAGAESPTARPASGSALLDLLERARDRAARLGAGLESSRIAVAADTHVGIVKRVHAPVNQDSIFCSLDESGTIALMMVADGVSTASYGSGDIASKIASACAAQAWRVIEQRPEVALERGATAWLADLMQRINGHVVDAVNEDHAPFAGEPSEVMGSTCVAAFVQNGIAFISSLGDSRAYLIRDGYMERITRDHNLATLAIAAGMDPDSALTMQHGDALARCLGAFDVSAGRLVAAPVEPDAYVVPLSPGDRLLLCSDGLTDYAAASVADAERLIYELVVQAEIPEMACLDLIRAANAGGGGDNVAVALCFVDPAFHSVYDWYAATRS